MKPFLSEDFLLESLSAKTLYHEFAAPMPIFDYHCHLPVQKQHGPKPILPTGFSYWDRPLAKGFRIHGRPVYQAPVQGPSTIVHRRRR